MRHKPQRISLQIAFCIALICALPGTANASRSQQTVIEDPARMLSLDSAVRTASLDEAQALGAEIVKIPVLWRDFVPDSESAARPSLDLTDPASYTKWTALELALAGVEARGMKAWFMVSAPAPRWAVPKESKPVVGAYQPNPTAFGEFMTALAKRFPSVRIWSIWNEPNLSRYLQPQYKKGVALSAVHYRKLYSAGQAALAANGHSSDLILFGELLPRAPKPSGNANRVPPVTWLREFFCIDEKGRPYKGPNARKHQCNGFTKIQTSGLAYHPYTPPIGPLHFDKEVNNATIFHLKRLYRVLDQAAKARRVSKRRMKIYSSEFGYQSDPPDINFTRISRIPAFLNISEYLSFNDPRVATYSQYLLVDDSALPSFQSGLRFTDGTKKSAVYSAFQLPLVATKLRGNTIEVWGCLRSGNGVVDIQVKNGSAFETINSVTISTGLGYFTKTVSLANAASKTFRLKAGEVTSRAARPGKKLVASSK